MAMRRASSLRCAWWGSLQPLGRGDLTRYLLGERGRPASPRVRTSPYRDPGFAVEDTTIVRQPARHHTAMYRASGTLTSAVVGHYCPCLAELLLVNTEVLNEKGAPCRWRNTHKSTPALQGLHARSAMRGDKTRATHVAWVPPKLPHFRVHVAPLVGASTCPAGCSSVRSRDAPGSRIRPRPCDPTGESHTQSTNQSIHSPVLRSSSSRWQQQQQWSIPCGAW